MAFCSAGTRGNGEETARSPLDGKPNDAEHEQARGRTLVTRVENLVPRHAPTLDNFDCEISTFFYK